MEIKDSGKRETFETGSVRDTREGKGRYDLLPPHALKRIAVHYENGAKKYAERNWEKGQPISRFLDSSIRHAFSFLDGQADEDHLAAACWNLLGAIEIEHRAKTGTLPSKLIDVGPNREVSKEGPEKQFVGILTRVTELSSEEMGNVSYKRRVLVYLAGPYSATNIHNRINNVTEASRIGNELWLMGFSVIVPHKNTHDLEGLSYDDYLEGDMEQIRRCDAVVMMPKWGQSGGAKKERSFAIRHGIPVYYWDLDQKRLQELGKQSPAYVS